MSNLLQDNLSEANIRHEKGGTSVLGNQGEDAILNYIVMNGSKELYDVSDNKAFFGQCVDFIEKLPYGITVFHEVKTEQWPIGKTIEECHCKVNSKMSFLEDMANSKSLIDAAYEWQTLFGTCNLSVEVYAENERGEAGKCAGWYRKMIYRRNKEISLCGKLQRYIWYYLPVGCHTAIYRNYDCMYSMQAEPLIFRISADALINVVGETEKEWRARGWKVKTTNYGEKRVNLLIPISALWQPPCESYERYFMECARAENIPTEMLAMYRPEIPTHPRTGTDAILVSDTRAEGVANYIAQERRKRNLPL